MRKCLSIITILASLLVCFPVQAQGTTGLTSVKVEILPEYDQPAVLVIYQITLAPDVTLPTTLNLRVPASAEVYAVAISDPVNGLLNTQYNRSVNGTWATLAITANTKIVQVEYYDTLIKDGTARHIVYEWAGDYAVSTFTVSVQQPVGATDLTINPALTQTIVGQDGFTYFQSTPLSLTEGQIYTLTIDYQKTTDALSTTGLSVQPAQPLNANTPGRVTTTSLLWVLAGVGGLLILIGIGGGIYVWRNGTHRPTSDRRHHTRAKQAIEPEEIYCNQCGKRAQPGDVFCRTCGMRLHKDD